MSELFTQTNKQKRLFRTEEDIVANIQTQFGMPHTGKDLLLDAKMGPNKDQSSRLDSEPDALSDTGMSDDVGAGDTSGILHDSAGGNKNTITGTNTPRSSRASAYYDLLRSQHKNGHYKAPAYRVVDTIESPLQAGMTNFSAYCREQLVKGEVRHYDFQVLKEQTAYIGRIAGSINQIAKRCNENKSVHTNDVEQLRREFLELKADYLERVVKLLRKLY